MLGALGALSVLATAGACIASVVLVLAVAQRLWLLRWTATRDRAFRLPLPKGSMGLPILGETLHWMVQGANFHSSRREKFGNVFKTHLLGKPVIRVTGAEYIRKIIMGEHSLVASQWPKSVRLLLGDTTLGNSAGDVHRHKRKLFAKVFSRTALENYLPQLQVAVARAVRSWRAQPDEVQVYPECQALTFHVAVRVLLGLRPSEADMTRIGKAFQQLVANIFSLPFDVPFSGLRKGLQARAELHDYLETALREKLAARDHSEGGESDAMDYLIESAQEQGVAISVLELKEAAVELIFAAYSTTASACTSLVLQLLLHEHVLQKLRAEMRLHAVAPLGCTCGSVEVDRGWKVRDERPEMCDCGAQLSLEQLGKLSYLDCVVKEVLRLLPPVSGGYRTALQTFEIDGYQVPKGWSVMYSIRDTHDTAPQFARPERFEPERFAEPLSTAPGGRYHYVPFGGGARSCMGRELARLILKLLGVELAGSCRLELASSKVPQLRTVPVVHPVDGLRVIFHGLDANHNEL
uniref:cytochrome P450 26B1-like n=1 Tax=Myxine glutinosa TaxID=7769 RepID=UPI00358E3A80